MTWIAYEMARAMWAFDHDTPSFIQSVSAITTAAVTVILCLVTRKYVILTRELLIVTTEQARAAVRPIVAISLGFQGGVAKIGVVVFEDEVVVTITNVGTAPLITQKVLLTWEHSLEVGEQTTEVHGFRNLVLPVDAPRSETVKVRVGGKRPEFDHFGAWSDSVAVDVHCSDLGRMVHETYAYQGTTGLRNYEGVDNNALGVWKRLRR